MKITKVDGHYFTRIDGAICEILHPESEGLCDEYFERLIEGHVQFIYPKKQKAFENINDHPELRNARVIALEWENKHEPFLQIVGIEIA